MRHKLTFALVAVAATFCVTLSKSDAQTLNAGSFTFDARADQTITLEDSALTAAGQPFAGLAGVPLPFTATGTVTLSWEEGVFDGGVQSAVMTDFSAEFTGFLPAAPGDPLVPYNLSGAGLAPNANFPAAFSGVLNDVQADSEGNLLSALWTLNTTFSFEIPDFNAIIYTTSDATFTGELLEGDANFGQVFSSPDPVDGNFFTGGDGSGDFLAAVSSDRTVTIINAVPEPSSMGLMMASAFGFLVVRRRS